jgi:hypothetical protein
VTARLAKQAMDISNVIEANTLEELALGLIGRNAVSGIVCSTSPDGHLRSALMGAGVRIILAMDDPRRALSEVISCRGITFPVALRRVASSCAAVTGALSMPGVLALLAERDGRASHQTALAISRHVGIALGDEELDALLRDVASVPLLDDADAAGAWLSIGDHEREIAEGALGAYSTVPGAAERLAISWAPQLFWLADQPDQALNGPVDITGRARCLIEGPRIHVRPGLWTLSLALAFSPEAAEHELLIEVSGCEPTQQHVIRANADGRFEGSGNIEISETTAYPLNLRISSLRAAFDGTIMLLGTTLARVPKALDAFRADQTRSEMQA